jgi:hypothetical protein
VWAGWGVFLNIDATNTPQPDDLSAFANGDIRFFVKAPDAGIGSFNVKVEFQCRVDSVTQTYTTSIADHGWDGTSAWQEIAIPLASYFAPDPVDLDCLGAVISPFMITIENLPYFNSFVVDNVRWHVPNSHPGGSSVQAQGRQLKVNGEPFVVQGMAYAPISICEDYHGGFVDRPDRYLIDFPLMAASGANAVRIYSSFMTTAMLDAAWAEGLYVIPTFQVDTMQLTCEAGKSFMRDRLRDMVLEWKDHPAILFWMVGSEVNAELTPAELCTDWYPQLDSLAQEAHTAEGVSFHPVGTANAETPGLADICQAGCSDDTSLPNLDFWAIHIYRGCSFGTAFSEYQKPDCARPLVIGEFGADAWDSLSGPTGSESETMQANCLESLLDEADQGLAVRNPGGVSSGQIIFEWADEWWKASPVAGGDCDATTDWCLHDTCKNWDNFAYPDFAMNEEWWGITSLDAADPDARGLRAAHGPVGESWRLGAVRNMQVVSHVEGGDTTITFDPAAGSTDHTLYHGPLSAVSSYGYSGSQSGLGATGSSTVTLPTGSLFWVVAARNSGGEGCYGKSGPAGVERPCFGAPGPCSIPPAAHRTCQWP